MTDNKPGPVRVEEPEGYDRTPTARIPVAGDLSDDRNRPRPPHDPTADGRRDPAEEPLAGAAEPPEPRRDPSSAASDTPAVRHDEPADRRDLPADGPALPTAQRDTSADHRDVPADGRDLPADQRELPADGRELPADQGDPSDGRGLPADHRDTRGGPGVVTEELPAAPLATTGPSATERSATESSATETSATERSETELSTTRSSATESPTTEPVGFFDESAVNRFRDRWRELQADFVDDPARAVRGADELVDEIMRELAERKRNLEGRWRDGPGDTEELRVAIREYRSFFNQLLNA